ncbi:MAG: alpha/beta fold hydrolase [Thermaerobacter sp.]|nr:alpha/beta fold hydrolase [Thermaerobacter sp.]
MSTIVTIHGAGDGGWAWTPVAQCLRRLGHEVFAVTLTGYGERRHLASPSVTLKTHITDVVHLIEYEQLDHVWLVGHSYGGWVATAVAEQLVHRLAHLVNVDAIVPTTDGQRVRDVYDPAVVEAMEQAMGDDAWLLPTNPDLADPRCGPVLWRPLCDPVSLRHLQAAALPRTYIAYTARGDNPRYGPVAVAAEYARACGWPVITVSGDHNFYESHPEVVAGVLHRLIREA